MKIDVTQGLRNIVLSKNDKAELADPDGEEVTVRKVCAASLVSRGPQCKRCGLWQFAADTQDGEVKFARWNLAQRFEKTKKNIELSNDEVKMLKDSIAEVQPTIVSGQMWALLDPEKAKQAEEKEAKKRKPEKEEPEKRKPEKEEPEKRKPEKEEPDAE